MTNPARMHLISEIPDPAAYFAKVFTRCAATNANTPCNESLIHVKRLLNHTYGKYDKYCPLRGTHTAPTMPRIASVLVVVLNFPAAKLLVKPPSVGTVAHLDVREPFGNN